MSMELIVKILVAPALIGVASWIARRWGPSAGGWFVALPLTSGPVIFLLAIDHGPTFARGACIGAMLAVVSLSIFAVAYAFASRSLNWVWSSAIACGAYLFATWLFSFVSVSLFAALVIACAALAICVQLTPASAADAALLATPAWDIPVRMALAALLVWGLTSLADTFGARVSGLLTPFPIATTILAAFTHRFHGGAAAARFLRSLLIGLYSFASFLLVVGAMIERWSIIDTFAVATLATLAAHAVVWLSLQRRSVSDPKLPAIAHD
jgi:hypothetical protein